MIARVFSPKMLSGALAAGSLGLTACATDLTIYPWVDPATECIRTVVGGGEDGQYPAVPGARGLVVRKDGQEFPAGLSYRISLQNRSGGQEINAATPAFSTCIDDRQIRSRDRYFWTAVVLSEDGSIIYATQSPAAFDPTVPIIVVVEPVSGRHGQ